MLERDKTVTKSVKGGKLAIKYKIPTALDAEEHIRKDTRNSEIISAFVLEVKPTGEDLQEIKTAEDLLNLPGGSSLVAELALEIVTSSILRDDEKN